MYVERIKNRNSPPAILVRESYWEDGKCKKRTLANLSKLPPAAINAVKQSLKHSPVNAVPDDFEITRTIPHGHVAAVIGTIKNLGIDRLIDSRHSTQRQLCLAMIAARILDPRSKLATSRSFAPDHLTDTLSECLGVTEANWNHLYWAMDWLVDKQDRIEKKLAKRHLEHGALVMYDLSPTWVYGKKCELVFGAAAKL